MISVMVNPIIAPSILAADFTQLDREIAAVPDADWIHVDIMDGHFVPNLSFGPGVTAAVNRLTDKPLDVHLMIENPADWVEQYIEAGADCIIFHVEAVAEVDAALALADSLRDKGVRAGFSLRPATPIEPYLPHLSHFDEVLIMSVEPGFGGQSFMPDQLAKVRALREVIDQQQLEVTIEIDGGISASTIEQAAAAGCDAFVAGSAVYGATDPNAAVAQLRYLAAAAR